MIAYHLPLCFCIILFEAIKVKDSVYFISKKNLNVNLVKLLTSFSPTGKNPTGMFLLTMNKLDVWGFLGVWRVSLRRTFRMDVFSTEKTSHLWDLDKREI